MEQINEKTYVPLFPVLVVFFVVFSAFGASLMKGSFWMQKVDDRLARIENKLDIEVALKPLPCPSEESDYAFNR